MQYPQFLKKNDLIGITAPSAGACHYPDSYFRSLDALKAQGYRLKETADVRNNGLRSADARQRAQELAALYRDPEVRMVMCAAGGDFLDEILPLVDFSLMKKHPKWLMGASDPTGLLYPLTVKYDVASLYGLNASSYDLQPLHDFQKINLQMLQGRQIIQHNYDFCRTSYESEAFDQPVQWQSTAGDFTRTGRCIGGCIDVLKDLIGTRYDGTKAFLKRYAADGFLWYFDDYSMSAENFYRTLLQMRYAGWFANAQAVLVGRVMFPASETGMSYEEAIRLALPDLPVLYQADIGHTAPAMTLINGAVGKISWRRGRASLSFTLQE